MYESREPVSCIENYDDTGRLNNFQFGNEFYDRFLKKIPNEETAITFYKAGSIKKNDAGLWTLSPYIFDDSLAFMDIPSMSLQIVNHIIDELLSVEEVETFSNLNIVCASKVLCLNH